MKRILFAGLAVGVLIAAWAVLRGRSGVVVEAAAVKRGDIVSFVDEPGTTRLADEYLITMPYAARIEAIDLKAGDAVTAGQVVARVSESDVELDLAEAAAEVARLEAMIVKSDDDSIEQLALEQTRLFDQSMASTVEAAQQQLLAVDARRKYAETQYNRVASLFRTGAQTQDDLDQAKLLLDERNYEYSQNALTLTALETMKKASELLPRTLEEYIHRRELDATVLRRQKEQAEVQLRQRQLHAERAVMKSPVDGVVLVREIEDEQFLAAGTSLLRIGSLATLEVEADVLSDDAVAIRQGNHVEIYGPSLGVALGQGVAGHVDRVAPTGFTRISSLGVEQQRVRVVIHFDEGVLPRVFEKVPLGVEYRVRVRIHIDRRESVPLIPRSSLFRGADGGWQVFLVEAGRAHLCPIEVGLMNDDEVEVVAGLEETDVVVLAPENNLQEGSRVQALRRE